ncbi:MAG TPA: 5-oxoprolinase subunit PxpB [Patescibacteria group bacterium]|nr:5-oxoprolinase subunit PxpB [Patescibacteria group bacterium]
MSEIRMLTAGEQGLVLEFGDSIDESVNIRVHQTARLLRQKLAGDLIEVVPTYRSLMIYFNPLRIRREEIIGRIRSLLTEGGDVAAPSGDARVVRIPVCYGGEFGPDLPFVAQHNRLTEDEVIQIHTATPYLVYMLGFTPGFPYLGGMSERIAAPRLEQPRTSIPAGSVGIAGSQTGFYPIASPGGWRLIGRTPIRAFNPQSEQAFLFDAGDYLQFVAVSASEYERVRQQSDAGTYQPETCRLAKGGAPS